MTTHAHTLTRHRDIQAWVSERRGLPAMVHAHNRFGELRARLALKFSRPARPDGMPAVTLTYDDALNSQLTTAAPSLKTHGLKATFFVTDVRANPTPWAALLADGHELASHTFRHPCPKVNTWVAPGNANEDYDTARMTTELDETIAMLQMLGQPAPYTFAYPCGITWIGADQQSYIPLIQERFTASRGVAGGPGQAGVNLYKVPATFSTRLKSAAR